MLNTFQTLGAIHVTWICIFFLPHLQLISGYQLQAFLSVLFIRLVCSHLNQSHLPLADLVWLIFQLSWAKSTTYPLWADL